MAVRTISTKLAVEGEAEYKQKIASCNSELKTLKSSLALVQSEYKNNANSMEALTAKGEALSAMQTAQAKRSPSWKRPSRTAKRHKQHTPTASRRRRPTSRSMSKPSRS